MMNEVPEVTIFGHAVDIAAGDLPNAGMVVPNVCKRRA